MADSVAVMHDGVLEQVGTPIEVYDRPVTRFVADFVGSSSFLTGTVEDAGSDEVVLTLRDGARVRTARRPRVDLRSGSATAMVRPERVSLGATGDPVPAGRNALQVTVQRYRYAGSDVFCHMQTAGGEHLVARVSSSDPSTLIEPGATQLATFAVRDTVLLAEQRPSQVKEAIP